MRWDRNCRDTRTGKWDFHALRETVFYSCPLCGAEIFDTPANRRTMSSRGEYYMVNSEGEPIDHWLHPPERKACHFNAIAVTWVPFATLVEEWLRAIFAIRYGDEALLKEFVLKRLAEFWNPDRHRPVIKNVQTQPKLRLRQGMTDRTFRGMSVDRQHGHYWVLVRDWHRENGSQLVHYEKVETENEVRSIQESFEVKGKFVVIDVANDQTKGLRICAKHGWTALQGASRKSFVHYEADGAKLHRIYSPLEYMDPWIGTADQATIEVAMIYFSKAGAMDRLFALRAADQVDYEWRVPGDVGDDYFSQLDSWERSDRPNTRTGALEETYRKVRKHDHLLMCELFQVVLASIMGVIGAERAETSD